MEPECRALTSELIPAVRAYLAQQMKRRYGMTQQEIAKKLGIAQVAVSKYVNLRYSTAVAKAAVGISKQIDETRFVDKIIKSRSPDEANQEIERFCERQVNA